MRFAAETDGNESGGLKIAGVLRAGTYTTNPSGPGSVLPHAVSSIAVCSGCTVDGIGGGNTINFKYDANGNLLCETTAGGCDNSAINSVSWTSFNKPATVTHAGGTSLSYSYDPEHNRVEMRPSSMVYTDYLDDPASGVMSELVNPGVSPSYFRDYVAVDGRMIAIGIQYNGQTSSIYYPVLDHLGSVSAIIDGNQYQQDGSRNPNYGKVIDRYSFDAFGMARDPVQWTPRTCSDAPQGTFVRGFTGEEHMPGSTCMINLNARIYSPAIGRFLSADPTVESPYNPQDLNRYTYVGNDPLTFTDPSGLCFLGCFWKSPVFDQVLAMAFVIADQQWELLPEFATIAGSTELTAVVNAGIVGGMAGAIATQSYKGAALGALQAALFAEAGNILQDAHGIPAEWHAPAELVAHGFVGGLTSVAGGHGFASGFLAAGVSTFGDVFALSGDDYGTIAYNTAEHAMLGGLGSVLGGGKFQNGAVTGAFGYLFNELIHPTDVGNDAHATLLSYAKGQGPQFWGNVATAPNGSWFGGGRPDLGNDRNDFLWEVKPIWSTIAGAIQVQVYSILSSIWGPGYSPADTAPSFFRGNGLSLPGKFGSYTYSFVGAGVIGYESHLNPDNTVIPLPPPVVRPAPPMEMFRMPEFFPEIPVVP